MLTPEEIGNRRFLITLRGYDRNEVAAFLQEVAEQQRQLQGRVAELEAQLDRIEAATESAAETGGDPRAALRSLGEETTRILVAAEESAREIEAKATAKARAEAGEARARAREIVDRANAQAARTVAEAERRRDAIAAEIRSLQDQRERFTAALEQAVEGIGAVVAGVRGAPETASEAPPEPVVEPIVVPEPEPAPESEPEPESGAPTLADRRAAALEELRPALTRQLKRAVQDVQNHVLASIREHGRDGELEQLLPTEAQLEDLGALGQHHFGRAYEAALENAAAAVDAEPPTDLVDGARVPGATATFRAVLTHEIITSLRATLRAGLEAQEPEPQLSERVGEVFRDLRGPVIDALVGEHLHRVYAYGLLDAWQELGVEHIRWDLGVEPRCPENRCRTNANEGPIQLGVDFPSGELVPPAHPGCTCGIVPA